MKKILNKGFTLIELLVVVAIIGILASVVLASLNTARTKGQTAAFKAEMNGLRATINLVCDGKAAGAQAITAGSTFNNTSVTCDGIGGGTVSVGIITGKGGTCTAATVTDVLITLTPTPAC